MTLSKRQVAYFEELFADYHNYQKKINLRKAELSIRELDENVGGGKSNIMGKPVENLAIKYMTDKKLIFLQNIYESIEKTLNSLDDNTREIVTARYFENDGLWTWSQIAQEYHYASSQIYRIRYRVLEMFANYVGLCNTIET